MDFSIDPVMEFMNLQHGEGGKTQVDRISHLPNHLIADILSYLPTKEAIRTSVLSRSWRHVWNGVTSFYLCGRNSDCDKFANLVDHVLRHCNSIVCRRFYLSFSNSTDLSRVNEWIRHAFRLEIEYLTLWVHDKDYYLSPMPTVPSCVLACSTLAVLELKSCFHIEIPDNVVCFPHLKSLELSAVYPDQANAVQKLLSRCPVLQNFSFFGYFEPYDPIPAPPLTTIDISIVSLKRLTVWIRSNDYNNEAKSSNYKIIINTPSLEYLSIEDDSFVCYEMNDVDGLVDVRLKYCCSGHKLDPKKELELFKGFSNNTKRLTLYSTTIFAYAITDYFHWDWPTFQYLDVLTLCPSLYRPDWTWLTNLLHNTPHLKILVLDMGGYGRSRCGLRWMPPDSVPMCLLEHLKIIGIKSLTGDVWQLQVVKYLLNNSRVLDSMMIEITKYFIKKEDLGIQNAVLLDLLMLPRASATCVVQMFKDLRIDTDFISSDYKSAFSGTML